MVFFNVDLSEPFDIENASVVYSIFTMQFLKPHKRFQYLEQIYNGLNEGGAFILAEKTYNDLGKIQEVFSFSHYDYKVKSFSPEAILSKERDLRFIMKPYTNYELEGRLKSIGFKTISTFWQMFNFRAYLITK